MNVRERVVDVLAEVVAELLRDDLRRVLRWPGGGRSCC